jgi:hypothetical protein
MMIFKLGQFTNKLNAMDIPVTTEELDEWKRSGSSVQAAFPHLTPDQREFLLTGTTPAEWAEMFPWGDDG